MSEPQREAKRISLERVGAVIGVVSGAIGLLVTILGLPGTVASALGQSSHSKAAAAGVESERAKLAAHPPRLDVSYVMLATNVNEGFGQPDAGNRRKTEQARTIVDYTALQNAADDVGTDAPKACRLAPHPIVSVAFLVIRNRGSRDADRIEVRADYLELAGPVRIREAPVAGDDYAAKLRAAAVQSAPTTIRVPESLGPGDGVRVPLWTIATDGNRYDRWCVMSRVAYLPRSVRFRDPELGTSKTDGVRRLNDPQVLANGVVGRG